MVTKIVKSEMTFQGTVCSNKFAAHTAKREVNMENVSKFKAIQKITGLIFLLAVMAFSLLTCAGPMGPEGPSGDPFVWQGEKATPPDNPECNWAYFNTADGNAYIWTGSGWDRLAKGGMDGKGSDGVSIIWQGAHDKPPNNPQLNWAYYNTTDKKSWIYDGTAWQVLTKDGEPGEPGKIGPKGDPGHIHSYDNGICSECFSIVMVQIPAGTFSMGGLTGVANTNPPRDVTLNAFRISRYAVTQELYMAVTGTNPSGFKGGTNLPAAGEIQGKRPVENLTWYDAVEFCNLLSVKEGFTPVYTITVHSRDPSGHITNATVTANWSANGYRLPTEAEWEYACRAGTTEEYSFIPSSDIDKYAWYSANSSPTLLAVDRRTHQVGLKLPNAFGLYDMHGNVYEWCWDWYSTTYYGESGNTDNPKGPVSGDYGRVRRGGSWTDTNVYAGSAFRNSSSPYAPYSFIGFRLVRR